MLAAIEGHVKNFSICLHPKARYRATLIYDVLSAHPVIGNGRNIMSLQDVKLVLAVGESTNCYQIQHIQRRHLSSMQKQVGLRAITAETIIEEVLVQIPKVVGFVDDRFPLNFPVSLLATTVDRDNAKTGGILASQPSLGESVG